jgi:hypothetical protein
MKRILDGAYTVLALCAVTAIASSAQTFNTLHNFCARTGCLDVR